MDTFSALADPTRRKILELLARDGPISATAIVEHFLLSPPAISQHLKVLREAQLVHMEKRAQQRMYRINPAAILELEEWAKRMTQLWTQRFDAFEKVLEAAKKNSETADSERETQ
jgi:DNA-binding transcriptional ArsR family regulator